MDRQVLKKAYADQLKRRLSGRLKLVASFVPQGACLADIGTDHGYVPLLLAAEGRLKSCVAADVREGPLLRAGAHIRAYEAETGCRAPISLRLSDGLENIRPCESDTVLIAGMGAQTVIGILARGRHMWGSVSRWILSPQSELERVRRFLAENGFAIKDEEMIKESGKFYTVIVACRGEMPPLLPHHALYGEVLIKKAHPILGEYLMAEEKRIEGILKGLAPGMQSENTGSKAPGRERLAQGEATLKARLAFIKEAQDEMQGYYRGT